MPEFLQRFVSTRVGTWLFLNVFNRIDRVLLGLTKGRISVSLGQPVLLLEAYGAKTGELRRIPLVYVPDDEDVVLIASNGGNPRNPAWYHNLRKNPQVRASLRGTTRRYLASEAEGEERARLWGKAVDYYSGYDVYQQRAGSRRIPVMVLRPEA